MYSNIFWYINTFVYKENKFLFFLIIMIGTSSAIIGSIGIGLLVPSISSLINDNSQNIFNNLLLQIFNFLNINLTLFTSLLFASILIFFGDFLAYMSSITSANLNKRALIETRTKLFKTILFQDFNNIIENKSGKISSIVNEQVSLASQAVEYFFHLILNIFFVIFLTITLLMLSVELTIISLIIGIFILLSQHKIYSLFTKYWNIWQSKKIDLTSYYSDLLNSIKFIKQSGTEEKKEYELTAMSKEEGRVIFNAWVFKNLSPFYTKGLATWIVFALVIIGINYFNTPGAQILIFFIIIRKVQSCVNQINLAYLDLVSTEANIKILKNYLNSSAKQNIKYGDKDVLFKKNISFKNVNFFYNKNHIIKNLSIDIAYGSFTSIVGNSGSGKTTIINLLSRIITPQSGSIEIDSVNINEFKKNDFFRKISIVSQDFYVYNDSIKKNICLDLPYDSKLFNNILLITETKDFINNLNDKEETIIGEKGLKLSGGQLQRLVLARALYKKPTILIIDEGTNAIDSKTEIKILSSIKNAFKNLTILNIAHRLSSVKESDNIYVLNKGEMIYKGNHKFLYEKSKFYKEIFKIK